MVKLRYRLGLVTATQHGALEYGSDLHINERQKIRHYRVGLLKKKNKKNAKWRFFTLRGAHVNCFNVIHSFDWKSAVEHEGSV